MLDLKALGASLAEVGLMQTNFSAMSADEVLLVAELVHAASRKLCIYCDQWERIPEHPWWIGKCRIGGHALEKTSFCTLKTDEIPF